MLDKKTNFSFIILFIIITSLFIVTEASASDTFAYGEISSSGDVTIESSTGKWIKMQQVYPLLKNTKLKTNEGVSFIYTKEGSKIDLSRNTEVSVESQIGNYKINLVTGTISFSISPSVSLAIITKDANISVPHQIGGNYSLVAGPGAPLIKNIQGIVILTKKGTYVRSISGEINVNAVGMQTIVLNSGESLHIGDGVINAESFGIEEERVLQGLISGAFFITGTTVLYDVFRTHDHEIASPSGF